VLFFTNFLHSTNEILLRWFFSWQIPDFYKEFIVKLKLSYAVFLKQIC
jgi:hypothetical protein